MAEQTDLLVPLELYLKSGVHIGTKFKTKHMEDFIYKIRPDGLYVLNLQKIDERVRLVINFLSNYDPKDILVVSRRENGWKPVRLLEKHTGIRAFAGRYPPGLLTNPNLDDFIEAKVIVVTDPWPDRNIIRDAMKIGIPVVAMADTNNQANFTDLILPCNNKGRKSLGLMFYIITREYLVKRGVNKSVDDLKATPEEYMED